MFFFSEERKNSPSLSHTHTNTRNPQRKNELTRLALPQRLGDAVVQLPVRVLEAEDPRRLADEGFERLHLLREGLGGADRVVQDAVGAAVVAVGAPRDADHGQGLGGGAGDGVEQGQPADSEGGDDAGGLPAAGARVAVGGVTGVELVAGVDDFEALVLFFGLFVGLGRGGECESVRRRRRKRRRLEDQGGGGGREGGWKTKEEEEEEKEVGKRRRRRRRENAALFLSLSLTLISWSSRIRL